VAPPGPVYPFLSFIRIHKKESSVKKWKCEMGDNCHFLGRK
jgi:hypothetical protein